MEAELTCKKIKGLKIANILTRMQDRVFPDFSVKNEGEKITVKFNVLDMSDLNELDRRLKHVKDVEYDIKSVEKKPDSEYAIELRKKIDTERAKETTNTDMLIKNVLGATRPDETAKGGSGDAKRVLSKE